MVFDEQQFLKNLTRKPGLLYRSNWTCRHLSTEYLCGMISRKKNCCRITQ